LQSDFMWCKLDHKEKLVQDGQQLKIRLCLITENMNFKVSEDYYVDNGIDYPLATTLLTLLGRVLAI
jgi:hypothetical protein